MKFHQSMLEKIILGIGIAALCVSLYFYTDFNSSGTAYLCILLSSIVIIFSYLKLKYSNEKRNDYETVEKENDELETKDGIFEYKKDGFYVKHNQSVEFIKWNDILEVNSFSVRVFESTKHSGLEIITLTKSYEFNNEFIEGIVKLSIQLSENLPNWNVYPEMQKMNNFGLEKANLYRKV